MVTARRPKRPTLAELEFQLADLRVSLQIANARLDVAIAQRDALAGSLANVLDLDDPKQHRWANEQQTLRDAYALIAELSKGRG